MTNPLRLSSDAARRLVVQKLHLARPAAAGTLLRVTEDLIGLHATVAWAPYLSLHARLAGFTPEDLDAALYVERSLVRIRCMRGTIFVVTRESLPSVYAATARQCLGLVRRYLAASGISEREYEMISGRVLELVADAPITAVEIRRGLGTVAPPALSAVLYRMCDEALLVRDAPAGGPGDNSWRYAPFAALFPGVAIGGIAEDEGGANLVERYVASYGPVTEADAAWWSGLRLRGVRAAIARLRDRLVACRIGGSERSYFLHAHDLPSLEGMPRKDEPRRVRLLPGLDPYVMGFRDRARYLDPEIAPFVLDRAGNITSTIAVDGRICGVWDVDEPSGRILYLPIGEVDREVEEAIEVAACDLGQLRLGRQPTVVRVDSMAPLAARSSGGFLAPLRPTAAS